MAVTESGCLNLRRGLGTSLVSFYCYRRTQYIILQVVEQQKRKVPKKGTVPATRFRQGSTPESHRSSSSSHPTPAVLAVLPSILSNQRCLNIRSVCLNSNSSKLRSVLLGRKAWKKKHRIVCAHSRKKKAKERDRIAAQSAHVARSTNHRAPPSTWQRVRPSAQSCPVFAQRQKVGTSGCISVTAGEPRRSAEQKEIIVLAVASLSGFNSASLGAASSHRLAPWTRSRRRAETTPPVLHRHDDLGIL